MRTLVLAAAVVVCTPGYPAAQSPPPVASEPRGDARPDEARAIADAAQAIVRGDYAHAAELLEPLQQNWSGDVDPAGAFFLAALYEEGLGVPQDEMRACALRLRSNPDSGPFGRLGYALARAKMTELGPHWSRECEMLAHLGFHHGFTPARFMLDSDHWLAVELSSEKQDLRATVSFRGKEATAMLTGVHRGAIFLPIVYTSLEGRPGSAAPRHFVEVATWVPGDGSRWSLDWALHEIVGADILAVESTTLATMTTDVPPHDVPVDLRDLVALRSTDAGGAEFEILNGADSRATGIATLAERQEVAQEAARRKTADEKVNWKQRRDPGRPPSFSYADADGCHDLFVYGWSPGRQEAIAVRADRGRLDLSAAPRTFDLAISQTEIEVITEVYDRPQRRPFCTDVGSGGVQLERWRAIAGTLTIQISPGVRASTPELYRATIQIDNAEFVNTTGQTVRAQQPIRLTAVSGQGGGFAP